MRRVEIIMSLFLMMGLLGCVEKEEKTNVITVDVTTTYPKKELVLQDLMDVEYIPLETNDEFITQGSVMAIGEKYILVKNWSMMVIFLFLTEKPVKG